MLGAAIVSGIFQSKVGGLFNDLLQQMRGSSLANSDLFGAPYFFTIGLGWLNLVAMKVVVYSYLKVYERNAGSFPAIEDVWAEFRKYFFKVLFYTIPVLLLILVGTVFC